MSRLFLILGALAAGMAVAIGALGAHGLSVSSQRLDTFQTGVLYHCVHALALIIVGFASITWPNRSVHTAGLLFATGIVCFSGSLYALVLTDTPWLGAITPVGGVLFILGWCMLAWGVYANKTG